jgi:hypothetical protein
MKDTASETIKACLDHLRYNKVKWKIKKPRGPNHLMTTAMRKTLWLSSAWSWHKNIFGNAKVLIHEITHYNDRKHVARWLFKWLTFPAMRVVFELRAYFAGMAYEMHAKGHPRKDALKRCKKELDGLASLLRDEYAVAWFFSEAKLNRIVWAAARRVFK